MLLPRIMLSMEQSSLLFFFWGKISLLFLWVEILFSFRISPALLVIYRQANLKKFQTYEGINWDRERGEEEEHSAEQTACQTRKYQFISSNLHPGEVSWDHWDPRECYWCQSSWRTYMHWRSTVQTIQQNLQRRIVKGQDSGIPVNWKSIQNLQEVGNRAQRERGRKTEKFNKKTGG